MQSKINESEGYEKGRRQAVKETSKQLQFFCRPIFIFLLQVFLLLGPLSVVVLGKGVIKIGVLEEPKTLNIWLASDSWSRKVLSQIYQPLYIREPKNLRLIPWLAKGQPVYDKATLSYTIKLRKAKWSDGSDFTSQDVAFTGDVIREFGVARYYSAWKFVEKIEPLDDHTVRFHLGTPEAIFLTRTLTTPIVQKREWSKVIEMAKGAEKPLGQLLKHKVERPVGTGPFLLTDWRQGAYIFLKRNEHFFGKEKEMQGFVLGPHINGMILKIFGTADAAILAMRKGSIDMFWWGIQSGYIEDLLKDRDVGIITNEKSALYYLGFNLRKHPFDDVHFRHAVATLIDKDFILRRILQGYATKMHSIVPPGNTFWHCKGLPEYGEGLKREDRVRRAYEILSNAKYTWKVPPVNAKGEVGRGEGIILPDGRPMKRISILTPPADYDPLRAMVGIMIQEWLRMIGIPVLSRPMGFSSLMDQVKRRRQFDLFVLGYGNLSLDPDYLRNFFHSKNDRPRGWNMSGYRNSQFDKIADESSRTMDADKRRALILEMQRIIMRDIPYIPLYNPKLIEAVRHDRFSGWVKMLGGIGNTWSFCTIRVK
ncbi:MAG: ABC transporter substrate-binding protein [Desulfobacteraceae bacterium]